LGEYPAKINHTAIFSLLEIKAGDEEFGEMAELAEGAPLLREYGVKSSIEGSNPSLSAN
jgi:hypothetical protein